MKRLVLFDIDGTLTLTRNGYVPFNEGMQRTFGIAADIRSVIPDGNTDPLIVEEVFAKAQVEIKIAVEHWRQFAINLHLSYTNAIRDGRVTVRALPGALQLLKALSIAENFNQGVVTGNFKVTAQVKLETAGLDSYLSLGAYGCVAPTCLPSPKNAGNGGQGFLFGRSSVLSSAIHLKISTPRARTI